MIAIGGVILLLDQTVFVYSDTAEVATWSNFGGLVVCGCLVILACFGRMLASSVLWIAWRVVPALFWALQASWCVAYFGTERATAVPWLWTVEPAVITLLPLVLRPAYAVVTALFVSATPALSSFVGFGSIPHGIAHSTFDALGNLVYVVVFIGLSTQLERLSRAESEVRRQRRRAFDAAATSEKRAEMTRLVHDEILSTLSAALLVGDSPPPVLREQAHQAKCILDEALADDRPVIAGRIDTHEAMGRLSRALKRADPEIAIATRIEADTVALDVAEETARAALEAVRNSVRHAGPSARREVLVAISDARVRMAIRDDGCGFDPDGQAAGFGLTESIAGRMNRLGGTATIRSAPNAGTEVVLRCPT